MSKLAFFDTFDRTKQLLEVAEEMQIILTDFYVNGYTRRTDEEKDEFLAKVGKVLTKYDEAYGTWE
jgi:hypothetical protein